MKNIILLAIILLCSSCSGDENLPDCINDLVKEFRSDNRFCDNASVISYDFQDQRVYAFADGTCASDGQTRVVDESCVEVCTLGGFGGFIECNGELFDENAVEVEVIWVK